MELQHSYDTKDCFFVVLYFIGRYLIILTSYFLPLIAALLGIGSVVSLEATNFFCPSYTEEKVRQHNLDNENPYGDDPWNCWYIERPRLNLNAIANLDLQIFIAKLNNFTPLSIIQLCIYLTIAIALTITTLRHSYILLYDSFYLLFSCLTKNNINPRICKHLIEYTRREVTRTAHDATPNENGSSNTDGWERKCQRLISCNCMTKWYFGLVYPLYYVDSKWRTLSLIFREWIEIFIQLYALMLFGGINVLSPDSNVLSQKPDVICTFSIIIASNCISVGIMWILYILLPDIIHGKIFLTIMFVIDSIFELLYCLFPLLNLTADGNIFTLTSLGLLNQENNFVIFQSLFAIVAMMRRCVLLLRDLDPICILKRQIAIVKNKQLRSDHLKPWIHIPNYFKKNKKSGFSNNELYRLIIARYEDCIDSKNKNNVSSILRTSLSTDHRKNQNFKSNVQLQVRAPVYGLNRVKSLSQPQIQEDKIESEEQAQENYQTHHQLQITTIHEIPTETTTNEPPTPNPSPPVTVDALSIESQNTRAQARRKCVVIVTGLAFITVGICILLFVVGFIYNDFIPKCVKNSHDHDWLAKNPELVFYNEYCTRKAVNMFNSDYPCNCREFVVNKPNKNIFTNDILRKSILHYNNLEGISLRGSVNSDENAGYTSNATSPYNFTDDMMSNVPYLKILLTSGFDLGYISDAINELKNLEILVIQDSHSNVNSLSTVTMPFKSIFSLKNLKALELNRLYNMVINSSSDIYDYICDWDQIVYFGIKQTSMNFYINRLPFDCISQRWNQLSYFDLEFFPFITHINTQFWSLPNLQNVIIADSGLNGTLFELNSFSQYSSKLAYVSLANTHVCNGEIYIDSVKYSGFGHFNMNNNSNFTKSDRDKWPLLQFIEAFDPCYLPCGSDRWICTNVVWKDGICNSLCNNEKCYFDGGDCNQMCTCDGNLWFNEQCDDSCNNTLCGNDFYNCQNEIIGNNDTCSIGTDLNETCFTMWTQDGLCDINCNTTECNFDNNICLGCTETCQSVHSLFDGFVASQSEPLELITIDELCNDVIYPTVQEFTDFDDNCTAVFESIDANNNSYIGLYEAFVGLQDYWKSEKENHFQEKLLQIDCSLCLTDRSLYKL